MESAGGGEVREREHAAPAAAVAVPAARSDPGPVLEGASAGGDSARGPPLSGTSYWLDMWLLLLFDFVLFVFVYLLP